MRTITPRELPGWTERMSKKRRAALLRSIHVTTAQVEGMVKKRMGSISPYPPIHTGDLRRRWKHENHASGGRVYNDAPHAGMMELGVRPGRIPLPKMTRHRKAGFRVDKKSGNRKWSPGGGSGSPVPMAPILRWCYLKFRRTSVFRQTKANPRGKWGTKVVFKTENAAWGVAVAVQRSLHYKGIRARRILTHPAFIKRTLQVTRENAVRELGKMG